MDHMTFMIMLSFINNISNTAPWLFHMIRAITFFPFYLPCSISIINILQLLSRILYFYSSGGQYICYLKNHVSVL